MGSFLQTACETKHTHLWFFWYAIEIERMRTVCGRYKRRIIHLKIIGETVNKNEREKNPDYPDLRVHMLSHYQGKRGSIACTFCENT